ncbi:DUF4097 family beta strand repeat-containing protein [Citrobacter gillenii]|jgi:hypothetical protein|uniref:Adhesin domain-containing protein n=1 Tax=Citrobacter gillenii TaxID=67828 RepID=A0ABD6MED3_9ENTR|nr:DUF4097 family beta strand repeat-containing protein [Citrobacter gillenii]NTZ52818.1 hypothetical protein [Citrobacter gillenii]
MFSGRYIPQWPCVIALSLCLLTVSADAKKYDWSLPENGTLTVNIARGALLIVTRDDGKPQVSLDLQKVNIAQESTLTTRKITGDLPSEEPQWSLDGQTATLTLPAPADIDLQKVKGVTAALILPATGQYQINGTLSDVYLKGTKNTIRINVVNGKVDAQNAVSGNVSIDVINGHIRTEAMKSDLSLKLRSGSVTDERSEGTMAVDLVNGDLTLNSQAQTIRIRQTTGKQTINAPACENFSNDLQTGSGTIRLGTPLIKGHIFSADGEIATIIPADWQGKIIADGVTGNNIVNQLSQQKPTSAKRPLSDEHLELAQGKPGNTQITLSTIGGVFTLQPAEQGSK